MHCPIKNCANEKKNYRHVYIFDTLCHCYTKEREKEKTMCTKSFFRERVLDKVFGKLPLKRGRFHEMFVQVDLAIPSSQKLSRRQDKG